MAPETTNAQRAFDAWKARGTTIDTDVGRVFMVDVPAQRDADLTPMFILHGYPTCSYDWVHVLPEFSRDRRVVLLDFPGFGLSDKPDMRYGIRVAADAAVAVAQAAGLERVVLVTHDMGDTVGGELLARDLDGTLPFSVERRLLSNGSIYIGMAQLSDGQQALLAADDALFDLAAVGVDPKQGFCRGVAATFSPSHPASGEEQQVQWLFASYADGHKMLARTIRYIEDRRAEEARFTGAIERHPSPLGVVWGRLDPIAVHAMTDKLVAARPDAILRTLDDVGHYPMVEAPDLFAAACLELLAKENQD